MAWNAATISHASTSNGTPPSMAATVTVSDLDNRSRPTAISRAMVRAAGTRLSVLPIVMRDELEAGTLVEHCRIPEVTESFYAIVQKRRFPNRFPAEPLPTSMPTASARSQPTQAFEQSAVAGAGAEEDGGVPKRRWDGGARAAGVGAARP